MTEQQLFIARIGRKFLAVWAEHETAPHEVERSIAGSHNWNTVERACVAAFGVVPQSHGVTF